VYRCLEDHREDDSFSAGCRDFLEAFMRRQSSDYKLNYGGAGSCAVPAAPTAAVALCIMHLGRAALVD
jgi:hypothetical protein